MRTSPIPSIASPIQTCEAAISEAGDDRDLLDQVATGDQLAFETLYARYAPKIRSYLHRRLRDPEALDEACGVHLMSPCWHGSMASLAIQRRRTLA
jgi:hypothetical protein